MPRHSPRRKSREGIPVEQNDDPELVAFEPPVSPDAEVFLMKDVMSREGSSDEEK